MKKPCNMLGSVPYTAANYKVLRRFVRLVGRQRVRTVVGDLKSCKCITSEMVQGWYGVLRGREAKGAFLDWLRLEVPQVVGEAFP